MTSNFMTELFYGKPEPVWVINNRRRNMDPYYAPVRGTSLLPDVTVKTPIYGMGDVARIKHALGVEGVFNVVCDVPEQMVTVSSNLSPRAIVSIIRQVTGSAHIINYVDPLQPTFVTQQDRVRYTSYDDSYTYASRTGYAPAYPLPYNGRSYDNEFRPGYRGYGSGYY
jgi:hypothetical protein